MMPRMDPLAFSVAASLSPPGLRSLRRVAGRVELWNGNRERWRNLFTLDTEESVIAWAWRNHDSNRVGFEAAMADPLNAHLRFIRLRSPAEVRRFRRNAACRV